MATTDPPTSLPSAMPPPPPPAAYTTPPNSQGNPQIQFAQLPQQSRTPPSTSANATPSTQSPASVYNAPTIPQIPYAQRQIRPPKSPMYVPAALRPTDRPTNRSSPLTPPRSIHGSTDSLDNSKDPTSRPLSRRSTDGKKGKSPAVIGPSDQEDGSNQEADEEDEDDTDLSAVTGPPARHHWKPDANASICDGPTCQKVFYLFERRHHCRHCGNVFCQEHSSLQTPLDQTANFHPKGTMVRACEHCRARYEEWMLNRREQRQRRRNGESPLADLQSPVRLIGNARSKSAEEQKGGVASSVTRDWNWSTF